MPAIFVTFVRMVDRFNYRVGRFAMYLIFVLMAVLLWSSVTTVAGSPSLWTLEMAQFVMVAYFVLGGPYTMQMGAHVRMDLFYERFDTRKKAWVDGLTVLFLVFYLGVMIWGAVDSTIYSFTYGERSPTAWRPYLWPIKVIMIFGFVLMLLQSLSILIRDIATLRGEDIA